MLQLNNNMEKAVFYNPFDGKVQRKRLRFDLHKIFQEISPKGVVLL